QEHRDHEAREDRRRRRGEGGDVPLDARAVAGTADRGRPPRGRLLLCARARQEQGDAGDVLGAGGGAAAAWVPLAGAVRARADLPRRRSRRSGDPDLAAARCRASRVRRARKHSRKRARGSLGADRALTPWWLEEAPQVEPEPPLDGDLEVDVVIVGGGYTGLWTALAVRELEPSARVAVLEAALRSEEHTSELQSP